MNIKRIIVVSLFALSLSACVAHNNQEKGAIIGGAAGGLLGTTIGGGSGMAAATIVGAVVGTMAGAAVGESIDRQEANQNKQVLAPYDPSYRYMTGPCSQYRNNEGAYSACHRGVAQANQERQRALEEQAYKSGRGY